MSAHGAAPLSPVTRQMGATRCPTPNRSRCRCRWRHRAAPPCGKIGRDPPEHYDGRRAMSRYLPFIGRLPDYGNAEDQDAKLFRQMLEHSGTAGRHSETWLAAQTVDAGSPNAMGQRPGLRQMRQLDQCETSPEDCERDQGGWLGKKPKELHSNLSLQERGRLNNASRDRYGNLGFTEQIPWRAEAPETSQAARADFMPVSAYGGYLGQDPFGLSCASSILRRWSSGLSPDAVNR